VVSRARHEIKKKKVRVTALLIEPPSGSIFWAISSVPSIGDSACAPESKAEFNHTGPDPLPKVAAVKLVPSSSRPGAVHAH
jgi:hypothetical protein